MGGTPSAAMLSGTASMGAFISAAGKVEAAKTRQPQTAIREANDFPFISVSKVDIPAETVTLRSGGSTHDQLLQLQPLSFVLLLLRADRGREVRREPAGAALRPGS